MAVSWRKEVHVENHRPAASRFVWGFFIKFFGGLGLWCLNPLSTIFRLYRGSQLEETEVHVENHRPAASRFVWGFFIKFFSWISETEVHVENHRPAASRFVWGFFIKFFGGLGLWCLNPLSTIFRLYRGSQLEETEVHVENHRPAASHLQTLSHNVVSSTRHLIGIRTYTISGDRY